MFVDHGDQKAAGCLTPDTTCWLGMQALLSNPEAGGYYKDGFVLNLTEPWIPLASDDIPLWMVFFIDKT